MTQDPIEKANELFEKFRRVDGEGTLMYLIGYETCKKLAVVAVQEIIKALDEEILEPMDKNYNNYWQQVKKEINNL